MPSKPSKNTTKTHRKPAVFDADQLLGSLRGHIEELSGRKKLTLRTRTVFVPDPIPMLKARDIAKIRSKLKLSQPIFARVLRRAGRNRAELGKWPAQADGRGAPPPGLRAAFAAGAPRQFMMPAVRAQSPDSNWPEEIPVTIRLLDGSFAQARLPS